MRSDYTSIGKRVSCDIGRMQPAEAHAQSRVQPQVVVTAAIMLLGTMTFAAHAVVGLLQQDFLLTADGRSHVNLLGGSAAYAAAGARLWSDSVAVFARVGAAYPPALLMQLAEAGISVDGVRRTQEPIDPRRFLAYLTLEKRASDHPTAHYLRTGNPFPKELIGFAPAAEGASDGTADAPFAYGLSDLPEWTSLPEAVHLCPADYRTHMLLPPALRERGTRLITLDPSRHMLDPARPDLLTNLLRGVDVFLLSEDEAARAFRPPAPGLWEMAEAFGHLGPRIVVIKCGASGQCLWDRESRRRWQIPAYPARARDLTGAGDVFAGGFLAGLAQTGDPLEAALRGNVSASIAIEGSGPLYTLGAAPGLAAARLSALRERVRSA